MKKTIIVDNKKIKLSPSDILGVGGEATVVQAGNVAIKLFHKPTSSRTEKLKDFLALSKLPSTVCAPMKLAYDSNSHQVVGYVMQMLSPQYKVIQALSSKKFRRQHPSISSSTITNTLLSGYDTITTLHKMGIVIGDNNDLNALFWKSRMVYIDADSFQLRHHPCVVGTENFLDPRLYDVELKSKPHFRPFDDWYSWFVMYIRSILMVHPYGGVHKQFKTVPQRAKARITFLDSEVKYPKAGLHPDLLNDDLKSLFDKMFYQGNRFIPPRNAFVDYCDSLKDCSSCGTMYPSGNASCPQCSKVNTQQIQRQVRVVKKPGKRTINSETIISTPGQIIWQHLSGRTVYVIANEKGNLILYIHAPNTNLKKMKITPLIGSPKFDLFGDKYLIYNDGMSDQLSILDISGDKIVDTSHNLHVDSYNGERTFACSKEHLFRISQGYIFRSTFDSRFRQFTNDNITAVSLNQTWITASRHSTLLFGCQRFFESLKFFTYRFNPTQLWYSPISSLKENESVIDVNTVFTTSAVLLLLKTEIKGKTYVHVYGLHEDKIKFHFRVDSISSDLYRNIHGKAFGISSESTAVILHPTDDGIVQESIKEGKNQASLLSETDPFVSESDQIDQYANGILVTGDQTVNYLTIS